MMPSDRNDIIETSRRMKVCVLIPTYNNAGTLRHVITDILDYCADIIVVNDGSTDTTAEILEGLKDSIHVVEHPHNKGKGCALKTGFRRALELGYEYAITIDSDGQHYASDLPNFIRAIGEHRGALIVGERDLSNVDINAKSSFANKFSNFWFHVQTGRRLEDTQTGYRAYPLKKLHGLSILTSRYEAELELLVFAAWNGVDIVSIPIKVYYPPQDERISHFKPGLDFTRISILNTILCVGAVIYGVPARVWHAISRKKIFAGDFKPFTHRKGERKEASSTLGRIFRSLYGIIFFSFLTVGVFTPIALVYFGIGAKTENKKLRFHKMLRRITAFLANQYPGCSSEIINGHNETFERPALIICNHQSHLDLPVLMSLHPKLIFLTNDWVWNNFFYGKIIQNAEFLPVSAGLDVILPQLKDLRDRGYSIVVFPEGTRSADCSILRFHQGAFYLAKELGLDIVPMTLHGAGHYLPKKDFMLRKGKITLSILPRVSSDDYSVLPLRKQASLFRKTITEEYNRLAAEIEDDSYFHSLVLYKYAYRGWDVVARCKRTLRESEKYSKTINGGHQYRNVRIFKSGIGTFALLYALVNKTTEVYAFESDLADYKIASETAFLPKNLHFIHAVMDSEWRKHEEESDLTIILGSSQQQSEESKSLIYLPFKS